MRKERKVREGKRQRTPRHRSKLTRSVHPSQIERPKRRPLLLLVESQQRITGEEEQQSKSEKDEGSEVLETAEGED